MKLFDTVLDEHIDVVNASRAVLSAPMKAAFERSQAALQADGAILICGNGGSAADAQHFAAELVGRYEKERRALRAIALTTDTSNLTAIGNDYGYEHIFSRQVAALGRRGDVLIAISTSGNSANIVLAAETARNLGMGVIAMTGEGGGRLGEISDVLLAVPCGRTARVQEVHELCLHTLAQALEDDA
ncbi:MAG: D-sedoheptulose 7-phosphate isomerase [Myxococcota bacterium]